MSTAVNPRAHSVAVYSIPAWLGAEDVELVIVITDGSPLPPRILVEKLA